MLPGSDLYTSQMPPPLLLLLLLFLLLLLLPPPLLLLVVLLFTIRIDAADGMDQLLQDGSPYHPRVPSSQTLHVQLQWVAGLPNLCAVIVCTWTRTSQSYVEQDLNLVQYKCGAG